MLHLQPIAQTVTQAQVIQTSLALALRRSLSNKIPIAIQTLPHKNQAPVTNQVWTPPVLCTS
jgi:hypothetical protein